MQPVDPRTIVRGPAALTMSFMTRADSHPWQVRWPEEKYSSIVTFLTPLKGSSTWVALVNVVVSAMPCLLWLLPDAEPARLGLRLPGLRRVETEIGDLIHVLQHHLAAAQTADEGEERRPLVRVVHRRPDLVGDHARPERRAEGVIAVDDPDGLRLRQGRHQPLGGERPEPAEPDETDLLALGPHVANGDLDGERNGPHPDQDDLRVLRHVLLEPRVLGSPPKHSTKVSVRLLDHRIGPLRRRV